MSFGERVTPVGPVWAELPGSGFNQTGGKLRDSEAASAFIEDWYKVQSKRYAEISLVCLNVTNSQPEGDRKGNL